MYIIACHKCGELKVVSSIATNERGTTEACWTCPKCGAGQLLEIESAGYPRKSDLQKIIKGLGFAVPGSKAHSRTRKVPWFDD